MDSSLKAQLQFGKTTVTGVFSEQKSQTKSVTAQGGGTIQDFELFALDYDNDRHFFLSQYFRNKYDQSLRNYPYIDSRVQITRIEVWVTNKQNRVTTTNNNLRNIVALQDLGESQKGGILKMPHRLMRRHKRGWLGFHCIKQPLLLAMTQIHISI